MVCEHVASATGSFARRTGAMVGLDVPVIPVQHQYIVTEPHPAIQARHAAGLAEMRVLRESDGSWYLREERGGLILGPYEAGAPACYVDGPAGDCEYELFQEDLERLEPHIEAAIRRVPAFGEVGVKQVFAGGELVGRATGGSYGFRVEKSLALAMVRPDLAGVGTELEIDVLGAMHRATVIGESSCDPGNGKLHG